ncbi:hypothetical protein E5Q_06116 [Mixia osmundae IAM 14324]|uniref:TECPR1-like DysF domain-containing protein n=1 Tax=Mixia osmundae (strain CBS 9802 / IAM 14324 / JCM 22182 / KY 12970) TaxID=764103 RepID=G7E9V0_MIXOS|nr:hypothetical protein E5Q_06116 [Mixia osmundae IAM 14324]
MSEFLRPPAGAARLEGNVRLPEHLPSTHTGDATPPGSPAKAPGSPKSGGLTSHFKSPNAMLNELLVSSVVNATAGPTTASAKAPLSLQTTTVNFRNFVQKSGPIFYVQDGVESIIRWEDPIKTVFCGCCWVVLCLHPMLLLLLPNVIIITILLVTHQKRYPPQPIAASLNERPTKVSDKPMNDGPPSQGSIDYLQNLQNIQGMMGRISDLTDAGRQAVPYLDWSNERLTMVILQVAILSGIGMASIMYYVPWKYVALVGGIAALALSHPLSISLLGRSAPLMQTRSKHILAKLQQIMEDDALNDEHLEALDIRDIELFENERLDETGQWSPHALTLRDPKPWATQASIAAGLSHDTQAATAPSDAELSPPKGYRWVEGEQWRIDKYSNWAIASDLDDDGWHYSTDFRPTENASDAIKAHSTRQRRWIRRAFHYAG